MLTTKSKLKIDVHSRQFSSCGFQMAPMQTGGWVERDGEGVRTQQHRGEAGVWGAAGPPSCLSQAPSNIYAFHPKLPSNYSTEKNKF